MDIYACFKNRSPDAQKLISYGFGKSGDKFVFKTAVLDGQFDFTVTVSASGEVKSQLIDAYTKDEYKLHLVEDAKGEFVGRVRSECAAALEDISAKCFYTEVFRSAEFRRIAEHVRSKYGDELEFLWEKLPDAAVLRRKDTRKWYAVIMKVPLSKFGIDGDGCAEVLDFRCDALKLQSRIDGKSFFAGYHMNKKHWLTVLLNGSADVGEIIACIDESYALAK